MLYHGTTPKAAESMLANGIDLEHPQKRDAGDMGLGFYLTSLLVRAKAHGKAVIEVNLDTTQYAFIENPYHPDDSEAGKLFKSLAFDEKDEMLTCYNGFSKAERQNACAKIREEFLKRGWKGIQTAYYGEVVVFDLATIRGMKIRNHKA